MLTENEKEVIRTLLSKPRISLRGMVKEINLGGVASAAYLINSLEKKGFVKKIGVATEKHYQLTEKALELKLDMVVKIIPGFLPETPRGSTYVSENASIVVGSTGVNQKDSFPEYWSAEFKNGSGHSDTGPNGRTFLSASMTKIFDDPANWQRYGDLIVWAVILSVIVLPSAYKILKDQWLIGFAFVALLLIIINKKII